MKKIWLSPIIGFLLLAIPDITFGQDVQLYGTIPSVLLKSSINDQLDYTVGVSSEINLVSKALGDRDFPAKILNLNLEAALSFDVNPNLNLASGFMYRFRNPITEGGSELRPWQQLTLINRFGKYRLRNRLRIEERWIASEKGDTPNFDVRLRYRVSTDFPLEGERLDDEEFYLNVSTAVLITPTVDRTFYFWDSRTYLGLGYRFNSKHRLEPALEFRSRRINDLGLRRHVLNFRIIWIAPLGG